MPRHTVGVGAKHCHRRKKAAGRRALKRTTNKFGAVPKVLFRAERDPRNTPNQPAFVKVTKHADFSYLAVVRIKKTNSLGVVMRITPFWIDDEKPKTTYNWLGWIYSVYVQSSTHESGDYGVHALEAIYNEDHPMDNLKGIRSTPEVNPMQEDKIFVNDIELDGDEEFNFCVMKMPDEEPYCSQFLAAWNNNQLVEGPFGFHQNDLSEDDTDDEDAEERICFTYVPGLENASLDIGYQ